MGLLNKKNIDRAKNLAFKNKDKIADTVSKATGKIDEKTGGKHADKLKKLDDAANKFAGRPVTENAVPVTENATPADANATPADEIRPDGSDAG